MELFFHRYIPSENGKYMLHLTQWSPAVKSPIGIIQVVHGVGEHIGRYDEFAKYMSSKNFIVFGHDHPGHGLSVLPGENPGFIDEFEGWDQLLNNTASIYRNFSEKYYYLPYFILGHGMGSFIVRCLMPSLSSANVSGIILSGTTEISKAACKGALKFCKSQLKKDGPRSVSTDLGAIQLVIFNNKFRPCRTSMDWLSSDEQQVHERLCDCNCFSLPSNSLFYNIIIGLGMINTQTLTTDIPVFCISGANDPVSRRGRDVQHAGRSLIEAGCTHVDVRLYPECRHELLHEYCRELVFNDIFRWISTLI